MTFSCRPMSTSIPKAVTRSVFALRRSARNHECAGGKRTRCPFPSPTRTGVEFRRRIRTAGRGSGTAGVAMPLSPSALSAGPKRRVEGSNRAPRSVLEALLLWALQEPARTPLLDASKAEASYWLPPYADGAHARPVRPAGALEYRDLSSYRDIAEEISGVITPDTLSQAKTARNFRDLIHPSRAQRLAEQCDRGTAHAAGPPLAPRSRQPSTTRTRCVAPSSTSGIAARSPASASPSSSTRATPRVTPRGFSTAIS